MGITAELARWSQALVGIAQTGLNYANNPYDVERYEEMLKLAGEMTATINAEATLDTTLADRLAWGWRQQVAQGKKGYVTPNVSVGAIIFNEHNELLLVRNATAGFWIFPVGNADVGYTSETAYLCGCSSLCDGFWASCSAGIRLQSSLVPGLSTRALLIAIGKRRSCRRGHAMAPFKFCTFTHKRP